jgi:hypothetical protein
MKTLGAALACGSYWRPRAALAAEYPFRDSTLSPDDRMKMISPELDDATMPVMKRVLETIAAGKKE